MLLGLCVQQLPRRRARGGVDGARDGGGALQEIYLLNFFARLRRARLFRAPAARMLDAGTEAASLVGAPAGGHFRLLLMRGVRRGGSPGSNFFLLHGWIDLDELFQMVLVAQKVHRRLNFGARPTRWRDQAACTNTAI